MKISYGTNNPGKVEWTKNGYGYATLMIRESLTRLGYEVTEVDKNADVEIWFDQPEFWNFTEGPYKIGYHPWESTHLKPGWAEIMNQCDEIWTPSPLIADWYTRHAGITVPVYVYEHGVDPVWAPAKRTLDGKMSFLHVGAEGTRKGYKDAVESMRAAFPAGETRANVELNCKMINAAWGISGLFRVNYINKVMTVPELVQLYHDNHVFVYPSWGEGFGLTPLQAMATGMPTICTAAWAPYAQFLDPKLSIGSELVSSPWPEMHPGEMLKPNRDDIVDAMRYAYDNYESIEAEATARVDEIRAFYDWDRLTDEAFKNLKMRLENSSK